MKALVTGASSGIGLSIVKKFCQNDIKVFGVARDFKKCNFDDKNFLQIECDITDKNDLKKLDNIDDINILVNAAGVGYFGDFGSLSEENIKKMIDTNLLAPILLIKRFLNTLLKNSGFIINISSISALKPSPFGSVYAASKEAIRHFSKSLFVEYRKKGLKVVSIEPDLTKTAWFDDKKFTYFDDQKSVIDPDEIAKIVFDIIFLKSVVSEIVIEPQEFRIKRK